MQTIIQTAINNQKRYLMNGIRRRGTMLPLTQETIHTLLLHPNMESPLSDKTLHHSSLQVPIPLLQPAHIQPLWEANQAYLPNHSTLLANIPDPIKILATSMETAMAMHPRDGVQL